MAGESSVGLGVGIFFAGKNKIALLLGIGASALMLAFLLRHSIIASEAPTYANIIGYGAGYWLWLTSAGLMIVSCATGLIKQTTRREHPSATTL